MTIVAETGDLSQGQLLVTRQPEADRLIGEDVALGPDGRTGRVGLEPAFGDAAVWRLAIGEDVEVVGDDLLALRVVVWVKSL